MQSRLDSARADLVQRHSRLNSPTTASSSRLAKDKEELASLRREFAQISVSDLVHALIATIFQAIFVVIYQEKSKKILDVAPPPSLSSQLSC